MACAIKYQAICAIDYHIPTQSQDYDANEIARTIQYELISEGHVKVTLSHTSLYYVMACRDNHCLIDDLLEPENAENSDKYTSFKAKVRKLLQED